MENSYFLPWNGSGVRSQIFCHWKVTVNIPFQDGLDYVIHALSIPWRRIRLRATGPIHSRAKIMDPHSMAKYLGSNLGSIASRPFLSRNLKRLEPRKCQINTEKVSNNHDTIYSILKRRYPDTQDASIASWPVLSRNLKRLEPRKCRQKSLTHPDRQKT